MTGTELINDALSEIGVLAGGGTPNSGDSAFALTRLNEIIDAWATEKRLVFVKNHASYTFTTSQQSYTIGPASSTPDFTAPRPTWIERANVVLVAATPDTHLPLEVINTDDYASLLIPALSADFPTKLYYQPTVTKGTLWPWPYPTVTTNQLELFTWNQLSEIATADVGNEYALPPGYRRALMLSLAEDLVVPFGKTDSINTMKLEEKARKARAAIESINTRPPKLDLGTPSSGGGWSKTAFLTGGLR